MRRRRTEVCSDLREALAWLGRANDPVITPALESETEALVARLRAAMPPAG